MKIGLIQVDGKIPNLALMKLSAFHKKIGDELYLIKPHVVSRCLVNFDKVYISCIFEENRRMAELITKQYANSLLGGIGSGNNEKLPLEIEHMMPDYDMFGCKYSLGFTTRGCIRKCPFCKVHIHEGMIRTNADIYEFWNTKHKHIVLLDNNILASPSHFKKIAEQIMKENLTVDFNQGLDIRLVNDENAEILSQLRIKPELRFAFDNINIEQDVIKGIEILKNHGITRAMWYVLVGFDSTINGDLYRFNLLKKLGQRAYCMRHKNSKNQRMYSELSSWVNQQKFFLSMDFDRFCYLRKHRKEVASKVKEKSLLENYSN